MKKISLIVLLVLVSICVFAEAVYTYTGEENLWFDGELIETGDTVTVEAFMYNEDFTLTSSTPTDILMDVTTLATSAVATQTILMTELANVSLSLDLGSTNVSPVTLYFNSTDEEALTITEDWETTLNTKYFYRVILINTATTTSYTFLVTKEF